MRIDAFNKISQMYQTTQANKLQKPEKGQHSDSLEISRPARDYQVAKQAVAAVPDIRQDKVESIREQLAGGTYNITGREVAEKLTDRFFGRTL